MFDKIKQEIKQDYYVQNFPNEGQRFVAWYLRNIHLRDVIQVKDDITDGADDKQIDAIVIDDDKSTIFIIQGKFIASNKVDAEPLREVLSSWVQLKDLVKLQEVANNKLKRKLSEVAKALEDEYEISFELITTSSLTEAAQTDLATFQEKLAHLSEKEDFISSINFVDRDELKRRYDMALDIENPTINFDIQLENGKYLTMNIAGTQAIVAAVPLKQCINFPGIKDGTLFQKNVRQSLGLNNTVNKGIKNTIYSDKFKDFFFFHNGVTAICNKMTFQDSNLRLKGLSVVNGCQSLNTILSCSEKVKTLDETYILWRFYEIPQRDRGDKISISTNSQSAVKPRDLRSNDKRVLNLKKVFEQRYSQGYFITKRGEVPPADKDKKYILDLSDLGKYLMSWHSQRPNIAYSEAKIFDKYFEQLLTREYTPENAQALNCWMREVEGCWSNENPLRFNETLLAMKAYAPYHHLYAISECFSIANNQSERVPDPSACYEKARANNQIAEIVRIAGHCLNQALRIAANEPLAPNKIFSPQNWIKTKKSLVDINSTINNYFAFLQMMDNSEELNKKLIDTLTLSQDKFGYRWEAD